MPYTSDEMQSFGFTSWKLLSNGSLVAVGPMLLGNGRLFLDVTRNGYGDCYCYDSMELAEKALEAYEGLEGIEPTSWKRHSYSQSV